METSSFYACKNELNSFELPGNDILQAATAKLTIFSFKRMLKTQRKDAKDFLNGFLRKFIFAK